MSDRNTGFVYLLFEFGLSTFFSLIGLIPFEEKGANGDNEEGVHDDENAQIVEVCTNEVSMHNHEGEDNVHEPVEVSPVLANHCPEETSDCGDVEDVQSGATRKFPKYLPRIKPGDEDSYVAL